MRFKIPAKLHLCGIDHPVRVSPEQAIQYDERGRANYLTRTITVDANMSPDQLRRTFVHEALHQMDDLMAIGLSERQVKSLATGIAEFVGQLEVDDAADEERD